MTHDDLQMLLDSAPLMMGVAWNLIVPALVSMAGMFMGNRDGSGQQQMTPEMREMLKTQLARMRAQEPLYQDVMGMARGLLPTRYRVTQGDGRGGGAWDGLRAGEDLRQPTENAQSTGRYAVPRNAIDDVINNSPGGRTPQPR